MEIALFNEQVLAPNTALEINLSSLSPGKYKIGITYIDSKSFLPNYIYVPKFIEFSPIFEVQYLSNNINAAF